MGSGAWLLMRLWMWLLVGCKGAELYGDSLRSYRFASFKIICKKNASLKIVSVLT